MTSHSAADDTSDAWKYQYLRFRLYTPQALSVMFTFSTPLTSVKKKAADRSCSQCPTPCERKLIVC